MILFLIFSFIVAIVISYYLLNPKKFLRKFLFTFLLINSMTLILYFYSGNIKAFFFEEELTNEINQSINDPEKFGQIDPRKIIFFLEKKLEKEPKDREGWLLLARTCAITGFTQKADLYYNTASKYFPMDEQILYEYSNLKRNINQFESALNFLKRIKEINPLNLKSRQLTIEILHQTRQFRKLTKEIESLSKNKNIKKSWINEVIKSLP